MGFIVSRHNIMQRHIIIIVFVYQKPGVICFQYLFILKLVKLVCCKLAYKANSVVFDFPYHCRVVH